MANPTVKEIVKDWLTKNGYTGLCGDGCGCNINDLMCCEADWGIPTDCQAGYTRYCKECNKSGKCEVQTEYDMGNDGECTGLEKPKGQENESN